MSSEGVSSGHDFSYPVAGEPIEYGDSASGIESPAVETGENRQSLPTGIEDAEWYPPIPEEDKK